MVKLKCLSRFLSEADNSVQPHWSWTFLISFLEPCLRFPKCKQSWCVKRRGPWRGLTGHSLECHSLPSASEVLTHLHRRTGLGSDFWIPGWRGIVQLLCESGISACLMVEKIHGMSVYRPVQQGCELVWLSSCSVTSRCYCDVGTSSLLALEMTPCASWGFQQKQRGEGN